MLTLNTVLAMVFAQFYFCVLLKKLKIPVFSYSKLTISHFHRRRWRTPKLIPFVRLARELGSH